MLAKHRAESVTMAKVDREKVGKFGWIVGLGLGLGRDVAGALKSYIHRARTAVDGSMTRVNCPALGAGGGDREVEQQRP